MMRTREWFGAARRSVVTKPLLTFYLAAVAACIGISEDYLSWSEAVVILLAVAILLIAFAINGKAARTLRLVNGERHQLLQERDNLRAERDELRLRLVRIEARRTGASHG